MESSLPTTWRPPLWVSEDQSLTRRPTTWWARLLDRSTSPRWWPSSQRRWREVRESWRPSNIKSPPGISSQTNNFSWNVILWSTLINYGLIKNNFYSLQIDCRNWWRRCDYQILWSFWNQRSDRRRNVSRRFVMLAPIFRHWFYQNVSGWHWLEKKVLLQDILYDICNIAVPAPI